MKKSVLLITFFLSFVVIAVAQMPVSPYSVYGRGYSRVRHQQNYNYQRYYNYPMAAVRGFNYNPPSNYSNYYRDNRSPNYYPQNYGYNYGVRSNYVNNCFPYQQNYYRYRRDHLIINGAVQIIRGLTLPQRGYDPYYYGNYYNTGY